MYELWFQYTFVPLLDSSTGGQISDDVVSIGFRYVENTSTLLQSAIICMSICKFSKEI